MARKPSRVRCADHYFKVAGGKMVRDYDPTTGRFISQDPIGFAAGDANLYRYVGNTPTIYVDPLGLLETVEDATFELTFRICLSGFLQDYLPALRLANVRSSRCLCPRA